MEVLETLPSQVAAVESQIIQLRTETRAEFSALRQEMQGMDQGLRGEIGRTQESLRGEMREMQQGSPHRDSRRG